MKRLLLIFLLVIPFLSKASHIVGGEFELRHLVANQYRLTLILYFDSAHGSPGARDTEVTAGIFRMADNIRMMNVFLPLIADSAVRYTNIKCISDDLVTRKLYYRTIITLSAANFSHPQGYYISWERCCRNYGITNIYSESPTAPNGQPIPGAIYAGQTFYLEFPPIVKDGQPFIDSTPELFPPLSDYGCIGKPYYVNFGGSDVDNDSLVYSLVAPLNTLTSDAFPPNQDRAPRPKPLPANEYPAVTWRPGYGLTNVMDGLPDLAISTDGWLTVTPTMDGLFVFAVKCEEFRNGIKIGETRRDFQMLVTACPLSAPPVVKGRKLGESSFTFKDNMTVTFPASTTDDNRCIEIEISDGDTFTDGSEKVSIWKIVGIGPKRNKNANEVDWSKSITELTPSNPSVTQGICFDKCPPFENTPYQIGIIVKDDACALPLLDTLRVTVLVQTPLNSPARFIDPVPDVNQALFEGTSHTWPIEAVDDDGDVLTFSYLTDGFNLTDFGMTLSVSQPQADESVGNLLWDAKCDVFDFSQRQNFHITMFADDADMCLYNKPDTAHFYLRLINPSADPVIKTSLSLTSERYEYAGARKIYDNAFQFDVIGTDADPFPIELVAEGVDFDLSKYTIVFPGANGISPIQSPFTWTLSCSQFDLVEKDTFAIRFMVIDKNNKCKIYQADTVEVGFKILPPDNTKPLLTIDNLHPETNIAINSLKTFWDKPIELMLTGIDTEAHPIPDNVTIELIDVESPTVDPDGYTFAPAIPVTAPSQVQTKFTWMPDCSIFKDGVFDNTYTFTFRAVDDHCQSAMADTVAIEVNIADYVSTDENFLPPNAITPNGDGINDFFGLDGYELRDNGSDPDHEINLPLDNCINQFEYIKIFNRWGKLVFTSTNRYFRWYAPDAAAGVYYYFLKFSNSEYKSSISVRY